MVNALMTEVLLRPLGIYVIALGAGFLIPLFDRAHRGSAILLFLAALAGMVAIAGINLLAILNGAAAIEIETAGIAPPFSINLRFGLYEGGFVLAVNSIALLGALHWLPSLRQHASALLLYLIMVMGINGMVMTRDLFNLFIFIEITSIATYALIGMERSGAVLAAGFKYIVATSVASAFFLLGTIFLYYLTGTLNIDGMVAQRELISGPIGFIATLLLLTSLLIELKPYPANGWGLDVYETAPGGIAALISVGVSAGVLFALFKTLPLLDDYLTSIAVVGGATFLVSNLIGLKQDNAKRLLGYSSIGQMGLLTLALAATAQLGSESLLPLIVGGLFINHLLAKAGLFWLADVVNRKTTRDWSVLAGRPLLLLVFGILLTALVGLPPFPGFWAKWVLVMELATGGLYGWIAVILLGSLLEAAYLFRWFTQALEARKTDAPEAHQPLETGARCRGRPAAVCHRLCHGHATRERHPGHVPAAAGRCRTVAAGRPAGPPEEPADAGDSGRGRRLADAGSRRPEPYLWLHPGRRRRAGEPRDPVPGRCPQGLLPAADHPAAVAGDTVVRTHQPGVLLQLGTDDSELLPADHPRP